MVNRFILIVLLLLPVAVSAREFWQFPDALSLPDNGRFLFYDPTLPANDVDRKTRNVTSSLLRAIFLDRANHSGSQPISSVTNLQTILDNKIDSGDSRLYDARTPLAHTQDIGTINGLQDALNSKQALLGFTPVADTDPRLFDARTPLDHTQAASTVTGLSLVATSGSYNDLADKPPIPSDATQIAYSNPTYSTVGAALDQLLYVAPSIVTHTNRVTYGPSAPYNQSVTGTAATNTIEIGNTVSRVELAWSLNKVVTTQSIAFTGGSIGSISAALRSYDHTGQSFTASRTYTLTVGDGTSTDNTPTTVINIQHKRYWGVSSNASLTDPQVIALSSEFATSRAQTRNGMTAVGQYIYFAYPDSWGAATFTINGLPNTDWVLVQRTFVNASGNSTLFRIYRSGNLLTGTYNVVVS